MNAVPTLCPDGQAPQLIELCHPGGVSLTLMDWGGTWLSCRVAIGDIDREVLLGCSNLADFMTQTAFLGATVGRYANRIAQARFARNGREHQLEPTKGGNQWGDGPYSVYSGGRWVRSSLDPVAQEAAETALRDGMVRYDRGKGWSGPVARIARSTGTGLDVDGGLNA